MNANGLESTLLRISTLYLQLLFLQRLITYRIIFKAIFSCRPNNILPWRNALHSLSFREVSLPFPICPNSLSSLPELQMKGAPSLLPDPSPFFNLLSWWLILLKQFSSLCTGWISSLPSKSFQKSSLVCKEIGENRTSKLSRGLQMQ